MLGLLATSRVSAFAGRVHGVVPVPPHSHSHAGLHSRGQRASPQGGDAGQAATWRTDLALPLQRPRPSPLRARLTAACAPAQEIKRTIQILSRRTKNNPGARSSPHSRAALAVEFTPRLPSAPTPPRPAPPHPLPRCHPEQCSSGSLA
jgi:hypothetical protein